MAMTEPLHPAGKAKASTVRVPNARTEAALRASDRNEGITHAVDAADLFRKLGIDRCNRQ